MRNTLRFLAVISSLLVVPGSAAMGAPLGEPPVDSGQTIVVIAWLISLAILVAILVGVSAGLKEPMPAPDQSVEEERSRDAA
ncbi:MAG TPA: hypothetical protein VMG41_00080 [Gemmatimonadales bacterium]|nr:hypothetical protein [Gemmatimonadales bacterium]